MIFFIIGTLLFLTGVAAFVATARDALSTDSPMAGLGCIFGFVYWLIFTLLGIISVLIGLLVRK